MNIWAPYLVNCMLYIFSCLSTSLCSVSFLVIWLST